LYKTEDKDRASGPQARARQWMKGLLDIQKQVGNSVEFIENVKIDLFPDEVYVFTPKGDIMELPAGATPIDFAYAVHTSVGNSCVAARIDHRLAPLSTALPAPEPSAVAELDELLLADRLAERDLVAGRELDRKRACAARVLLRRADRDAEVLALRRDQPRGLADAADRDPVPGLRHGVARHLGTLPHPGRIKSRSRPRTRASGA